MTRMQAATVRRYGGPESVQIESLPMPSPKPGEVRIRVTAAAVTAADARLRANDAPRGFGLIMRALTGFLRPRNPVPGMEFAGIIDRLGPGSTGFVPGQRVFGVTGLKGGAHAEYLTIKTEARLFAVPETLTDPEAAAFFFGGLTAADFLLDKARLQPGERLLVNGATGSVGSAALQLARHLGAHTTAVCRAENAATARALGADAVIDYRSGPLLGEWDVILDVVGTLPYPVAAPHLAPGGRLLPVTATLGEQLSYAIRPKRGPHRITGGVIVDSKPAMLRLIGLHAAGAYRPVIGETLAFTDIAKAHASAGSRHKLGNLVVVMPAASES